jgi:phage tail-like protein
MKPVEFRRQVFRDSAHWDHGLPYKLERLNGGGVALFSRPTFQRWVVQADKALSVTNFAVDHCGRIFWVDDDTCELYRYDPISLLVEAVITLADCSEGKPHSFGRMLSVMRRLLILDHTRSRVIILRIDTFQIIAEIPLTGAIDLAWAKDRLFVLDRNGIAAYDVNGSRLALPRREHQSDPVAIGADPTGKWVYLVDNDAGGFLRFNPDGSFADEFGKFSDAGPNFKPRLLAVNSGGNLFVCDGSSAVMHEFSPDGGYIGNTGDVSPLSKALGMTFGSGGDLYVGSPEGIAHFSFKTGLAGNQGVFYSATLDSGGEGNDCWHRIDLVADLDAGGTLDVSYATADNAALASAVNNIIKQETPVKERVDTLEALLDWKDPEVLRAFSPDEVAEDAAAQSSFRQRSSHSILFRSQTKRYLWLRLALSGLARSATAAVREMRVYYPRLSYLRYLPAVYQENPASREFLERFLSIFETVFSGLEATIERIPEVFDPEHTPKEFLDWLGQWLDLGIEEDWSPEVKRRLINSASSLYQKKGRPDGLVEFIEIVTGKRPFVRESFETQRPLILGDGSRLGRDTRIFRHPTKDLPRDQWTVLGVSSRLGSARIRSTTQIPIDPFRAAANHFTLLLDLSPREFQRHERGLHRIIRENSPAHVAYDIRLVSGAGLGSNMVLGVNFKVEDPQPFYIGHSSLGRSILSGFSYGPELGIDTTIAGRECGSSNASDVCYGEQ